MMTDFQKELILMVMCFSFFFVCSIFAENAIAATGMLITPLAMMVIK